MRINRALFVALAVLGLAGPTDARASTVTASGIVVFGDSIADPGNRYVLSGGTFPPSPPYFEGQFSNGDVWAKLFARDFTDRGLPAYNYAYGGAKALPDDNGIPDLPDQVAMALADLSPDALGPSGAALYQVGGNDLLTAIQTQQNLADIAFEAANAVADAASVMFDEGRVTRSFLLNIPDLGLAPALASDPAAAAAGTLLAEAFNATLAARAAQMTAAGMDTRIVDIAAEFAQVIADPEAYGLSNVTTPCLIPDMPPCTPEQAEEWFWFDPIHPNGVVHAELADRMRTRLAPVPVPGAALLLVSALAGLGALRRPRLRAA